MKFRSFLGSSLALAQRQVREALGEEAVILSTSKHPKGGVEIVCAVEPEIESNSERDIEPETQSDFRSAGKNTGLPAEYIAHIIRAFHWHRVPENLTHSCLEILDRISYAENATQSLAMALRRMFRFGLSAHEGRASNTLALVGLPGQGKTVTVTKLALAAKLAGEKPVILCADTLRLGAKEQAARYAEKIDCPIFSLSDSQQMAAMLDQISETHPVFIDTPGINPHNSEERGLIHQLLANERITPVLVLGTIIDTNAAVAMVSAFGLNALKFMILTLQDIDPSLGPALGTALHHQLQLLAISQQPQIARGIEELNAEKLSALILKATPRFAPSSAALPETLRPAPPMLRRENSLAPERQPGGGRIRVIASGKGGVGKTFLSIALAHALARRGQKLLLFDGDLGLANIDIQLGLHDSPDIGQYFAGKGVSLGSLITRYAPGGFDIIAGRSGSGSLATLSPGRVQQLRHDLGGLAARYDQILLDLGAGIDRTVQLLAGDAYEALIITDEEPTALADAYALVKILHRQHRELRQRIIVNRASSVRHGERTLRALRETCRQFLKFVPEAGGVIQADKAIPAAIRARTPLAPDGSNVSAARSIRQIAETLIDASESVGNSRASKISETSKAE